MKFSKNGNWKIYWGEMPLPKGAETLGTIKRDGELTAGALIRLATGIYVQGNAGAVRSLPQHEVDALIIRSNAAAALASISTDATRRASRENGKLGGRPRKASEK